MHPSTDQNKPVQQLGKEESTRRRRGGPRLEDDAIQTVHVEEQCLVSNQYQSASLTLTGLEHSLGDRLTVVFTFLANL